LYYRDTSNQTFRQLLDGGGNSIGGAIAVAAIPVKMIALSDGGYVAFWENSGQRFDGQGNPVGELFQVGFAPEQAALLKKDGSLVLAATRGNGADKDVFTQLLVSK
jgi:hypothetical protein